MKVLAERSTTVEGVGEGPAVCHLQDMVVEEVEMEEGNMEDQDRRRDTEMTIEMIGIDEDLHPGEEEMTDLEVLLTGVT